MVISIATKIYTTYCFFCEKMTETLNIKRERRKDRNSFVYKGICEECKRLKVDLDRNGHWE